MEATVRILNQSGLITRQYTDKKTGEQKVINSVMLKLTDGTGAQRNRPYCALGLDIFTLGGQRTAKICPVAMIRQFFF